MPKPTKGPRLGGGPAHERLILANLAAALFTHRSIQTTETKAKRLRPLAERLVTFAKRGDLHARRRVLSVIGDKEVVHVLFTDIAPLVENRPGGYTRITKIGNRKGDNAPMAVIELVLEPLAPKSKAAPKSTSTSAKAAPEASAPALENEEAAVTESTAEDAAEDAATDETAAADATDDASTDEPGQTDAGAESPEEGEAAEADAADAVVTDDDQK